MTNAIILFCMTTIASASAFAQLTLMSSGQVYEGQEYVNERATGRACFVSIEQYVPLASRGLHCSEVSMKILSNHALVPKADLVLNSRITNADTPMYQTQKTCAANVNGSISGDEVYGLATDSIYTPFFIGGHKKSGTQYDYFLTIDAATKLPRQTRYHVMNWRSEVSIDCANLRKL